MSNKRCNWQLLRWLLSIAIFSGWSSAVAQSSPKQAEAPDAYTLRLPVDEVMLTFNATDKQGLPINDLKAAEVRVRDNGIAPRRIVAFDNLVNRPIHAGVLLDASGSMRESLSENKAIARKFIQHLFREKSDEAFVSVFGYASDLIQPWTGNVATLSSAIEAAKGESNTPGGTALFTAIFRACHYSFDNVDPSETGNFILLFTDGEDNAGLTSSDEAARACQRSNTEIFAFVPSTAEEQPSTGPRALRELLAKTGGQVFLADDSDEAIWNDLKTIEAEMRNQYRLVYNPADFKHDGAFHEIQIQPPDRVSRIRIRTGYFAPKQ